MSDVEETLRILGEAWGCVVELFGVAFIHASRAMGKPERNPLKAKAMTKKLPHWMRQFCKRAVKKRRDMTCSKATLFL